MSLRLPAKLTAMKRDMFQVTAAPNDRRGNAKTGEEEDKQGRACHQKQLIKEKHNNKHTVQLQQIMVNVIY